MKNTKKYIRTAGRPVARIRPARFRVGDQVRVRYRGQEGTIIDINAGLYMVSLEDGKIVDSYPESSLERV